MSQFIKVILLALPLSLTNAHAMEKRVRDFLLDDHTVYEVPVSGARVTTISFPSAIAAVDAALTTSDGKTPGFFQIAHTKGTAYLSVRALAKDATTNLNVRWNNRTYVFELRESPEPWYSVVLQSQPAKSNHISRPLTPPRLIGLLDKAKAFSLLKTQQPDAVAGVEHRDLRDKPQISDCGDYEVRLMEAFRFPDDDTLVFQLTITNRTDKPIEHTPEKFEVHIGDRTVNPSVSDLTSSIAAHETVSGYIAVSGGLEGPNNVSLKNEFTFALTRRDPTVETPTSPTPPTRSPTPEATPTESTAPESAPVEPTPIPQ
jgi:hypothetical protein